MKELELKKPIIAHGETLSVLEFDEPTGKDVRELGYPRMDIPSLDGNGNCRCDDCRQ